MNNGASPSTTLTFEEEVGDEELREEVMNLDKRGVTGCTKAGFVARDTLINERKSMMVGRFSELTWCFPSLVPAPEMISYTSW